MLIRRIARPMLASVFIASGIKALRNPELLAETAQPFVSKAQDVLPDEVVEPIPSDTVTMVRINGAVQLGGGVLLAAGKFPRIAALGLAGSLVPTTLAGHDFWNKSDPQERQFHQTQFLKNVSLLGGLIITAVDTEGKPSLAWRSRKAAEHASDAVSSALPFTGDSSGDTLGHLRSAAADRASQVAEIAKDRGPVVLEAAKERTTPLAEAAANRGSELGEKAAKVARKRAEKARKVARKEGNEAVKQARKRGSELADEAQKRGAEFIEQARERSMDFADTAAGRGSQVAAQARDRAADWTSTAGAEGRKLSRRAQKRAEKAAVKRTVATAVSNLR